MSDMELDNLELDCFLRCVPDIVKKFNTSWKRDFFLDELQDMMLKYPNVNFGKTLFYARLTSNTEL